MDLNVENIINDELERLIDIPQEESQYKIDMQDKAKEKIVPEAQPISIKAYSLNPDMIFG